MSAVKPGNPRASDPPAPDPPNALPETGLSIRIDRFLRRAGEILSWIWLVLLAIILINVLLRYAFGSGRVEFEELQWHLYSIGFLGGLAYCAQNDSHIRVDVLYERFSPRMRAWIDLYGILLLCLPFCALILASGIPFVAESFASHEISPSPGGLGGRFLIKAALPLAAGLLALAYFSRLLRLGRMLFGDTPQAGKD
jgi:TRAP-type mannitol/chloroaromatic compound transport system permease small subunit